MSQVEGQKSYRKPNGPSVSFRHGTLRIGSEEIVHSTLHLISRLQTPKIYTNTYEAQRNISSQLQRALSEGKGGSNIF